MSSLPFSLSGRSSRCESPSCLVGDPGVCVIPSPFGGFATTWPALCLQSCSGGSPCTRLEVKKKNPHTYRFVLGSERNYKHFLCMIFFSGHFGGGVQSYFLFLRFLVILNFLSFLLMASFVIIPSIVFHSNNFSGQTLNPSVNLSGIFICNFFIYLL